MSNYTYEEVLPGIHIVPYPLRPGVVVSMVLARGERLALIDTAFAEHMPAAIEPGLAALGATVADIDLIINTHPHGDHVGGNEVIRQASSAAVWAPVGDADSIPTPVDHRLSEGDTLDLGDGLVLEVIHLPGHTPGHIGLYERRRRLLIGADALQARSNGGVMPLVFHSGHAYRQSIHKALGMDIDVLTLGHAYHWSGERRLVHRGADVRRFLNDSLDALDQTEGAVRAALDACPDQSWECLERAFVIYSGHDAGQPVPPMIGMVLRSLLRDQGIDVAPA